MSENPPHDNSGYPPEQPDYQQQQPDHNQGQQQNYQQQADYNQGQQQNYQQQQQPHAYQSYDPYGAGEVHPGVGMVGGSQGHGGAGAGLGLGIATCFFGLLSFIPWVGIFIGFFAFILGITGIIISAVALGQIKKAPNVYKSSAKTHAKVGLILSIVGVVLPLVMMLIYFVMLAAVFSQF